MTAWSAVVYSAKGLLQICLQSFANDAADGQLLVRAAVVEKLQLVDALLLVAVDFKAESFGWSALLLDAIGHFGEQTLHLFILILAAPLPVRLDCSRQPFGRSAVLNPCR